MNAPQVKQPWPGPKVSAALEHGRFDLQSGYRSIIFDDQQSTGVYLQDLDGNTFLDFFSSFALGALGYNHPALIKMAKSDDFVRAAVNPSSTPFLTTNAWLSFIDDLQHKWAPKGMSRAFFVDAGGEGVESALKAAFILHGEARREAQALPENPLALDEKTQQKILNNMGTDAVVVSFEGAFHGRGIGPLSATHSKVIHKADIPAFDWPMVPFPACKFPLEENAVENAELEKSCLNEIERVLNKYAGRIACVIVEPIQCEGGDRHARPLFFQSLRKMCTDAGVRLMFDEVQTGMGVTGKLWAHQWFDLVQPPDFMSFGKKMQMGGFFCTPKCEVTQFGRMYQTRNGDRARGLMAHTILNTIDDESLLGKVRDVGAHLVRALRELQARHTPLIDQVRGLGFLVAFDMPNPKTRDDFLARARARGVFASYTGMRSVRLRPHLITTHEHVEQAIPILDGVLAEMNP